LADAITGFSQFSHIIFYSDGLLQIAEIDSILSDGTEETITLTAELDTAVDAEDAMCGGAMVVRCFADALAYEFASLEFAKVDARFIELPNEYPSGSGGGEGDDEIINNGGGSPDPPLVCGGGIQGTVSSDYMLALAHESDPNAVLGPELVSIAKALFLNERAIQLEGVTVNSYGPVYWATGSNGSPTSEKMLIHKIQFPSTDPTSPDGEVTASMTTFWYVAQDYCYTP
jgi:hypothetical protein